MTPSRSPGLSCEEILRALNEYVDTGTLAAVCREFAEHLAGCNPCQIVVDNIKNTIRLYKDGEPYSMPAGFCDRMREALRARWQARFPAGGS